MTDSEVPTALDTQLVPDNYATHKHPQVQAWLAQHEHCHLHFTPTYSSWLNQMERWFGLLGQRAIKRRSFRNVKELANTFMAFTEGRNASAKPFIGAASAQSIIEKAECLSTRISDTSH